MTTQLPSRDIDILRRLASRKMEIAHDPTNRERRAAWYALDRGGDHRPMVLAEHEGIRDPVRPIPDSRYECSDLWARGVEKVLRRDIYWFEELKDDRVVEPWFETNWKVTTSNFGVDIPVQYANNDGHLASRHWDPPIQDLDRDFDKLRPRRFSVDRPATHQEKARLEEVFEGIMPVRMRGFFYWTMGLTWRAIELVGLENLMLFMFDNPDGLHRLMRFLRDDHIAFAEWLEREGLYSLNNEGDMIGSGSIGYTRDLPQPDWRTGMPVRTKDLWVLLESQETVGVGPEQFEEFVFPYQQAIAERFGRVYYGCCEPVNNRWHILKRIPNLARVSVSPWADQVFMAEQCGSRYVFSRKPNPALISTGTFDEAAVRADIRQTLDVACGCRVELIMKDVHTLHNEPHRLPRWVQIAREEIARRR